MDTQTRTSPKGIPAQISDPETLARELYGRGQWQRVHIIDRHHLAWVAQQAQATHRLTFDAYYHLVYTLLWGNREGYACERGLIRRVTTFEGLHATISNAGPTEQTLTTLCEALDAQFAPPAAVLLCTYAVFSGWLAASDKPAYLDAARVDATAIWRIVPIT